MTENAEPTSEAPAPETVAVARRSFKDISRLYAGWIICLGLGFVILASLLVTLCSHPLQMHVPKKFEQTVPRKTVPTLDMKPNTPPPSPLSSVMPTTSPIPQQSFMVMTPAVVGPKKPEPTSIVITSVVPPLKNNIPTSREKPFADHHLAHFDRPVIAIVIDDMGLDRRRSLQAVNLPVPVTLAFMPYAQDAEKQTEQARQNGHELIVHMPMEPDDLAHNNPGPNALLLKNGEAENMRRLDKNLTAFTGFIGINNHMGSALTSNRAAITPVLQDLKEKGLWFLDSKTDARSVAANVADEIGLPFASRDVFLDNVNSTAAVLQQLRETEAVARHKGYAIAIGHPKDGTIAALQSWMRDAESRGFILVPLSTIIAARFPNAIVPKYAKVNAAKIAGN